MDWFKDATPLRLYAAAIDCANIENSLKAYLIFDIPCAFETRRGQKTNIITPFVQPSLPFLLSSSVKPLSLFVSLLFRSSRYQVPLSTSNIPLPPLPPYPPPDLI